MKKGNYTVLVVLFTLLVLCPAKSMAQNIPPVADAGLSRYAARDPVVLDGTGSFDPDDSGPLSYTWQQISGPSVVITDANTANPVISGFVQTDAIKECEFELVVSDGELTSPPDTIKVIIVPDFGTRRLGQQNPPFDPDKPTVIYFGGGNCVTGGSSWSSTDWAGWDEKANIIIFLNYFPDPSDPGSRTYYRCGDVIIVYLSSVAPDYKQPIQAIGFSTGGDPAMDVGIHLNRVYRDARYAVNHVTEIDAPCRIVRLDLGGSWDFYNDIAELFRTSAVDGEQCWIDGYQSSRTHYAIRDILQVSTGLSHVRVRNWYRNSLTGNDMNNFNNGVLAGAYWSVIGPGKNLQLAPQTDAYYFRWDGSEQSGAMSFFLQSQYPGRLPEPVKLVGPADGAVVDANGAILSCEESENAIGYKLLFGSDPYRVMDYGIVSDTPTPPVEVITTFPFEETWWTVKVRDRYGSTIYADPICINAENVTPPVQKIIENVTIGKGYGSIQDAIDEAEPGDEIVIGAATYQYHEKINFKGKNLTVRSTDPNDPAIVAATVINGGNQGPVVTFSGGEDANCVLAGFTITDANDGIYCYGASPTIANCTITGGKRGIYCSGASPTITNCTIAWNVNADLGAGMYLKDGSSPTLVNCTFSKNSAMLGGGMYSENSSPILTNCTFSGNSAGYFGSGICINGGSPMLTNCILWGDTPDEIFMFSETPVITYSNVQGGWAGEGNIDADPLFAEPGYWTNANDPNIIVEPSDPNAVWVDGDYHLKSQAGRYDPNSQTWVLDDVTSPCIDAGDPGTPIGLEPLPNGGIINMGAYGGTAEASKSPAN